MENTIETKVAQIFEAPVTEPKAPVTKMGTKMHRTATMISDKEIVAKLNSEFSIQKADGKVKNGFWAYASVELPQGDSDGDIISIDGIQYDVDPDANKYLPLLPSHKMVLSNAHAAEIGRIERLVKTKVDGMPALCMYFTFALDEEGKPIDDLVASYYKRYTLGYSNTFSVGMEALAEPEPIPQGGYRFGKTKLYEISAVAIPANSGAVGLTRSAAEEDELLKTIKGMEAQILALESIIDKSFSEAFKPLQDRLDMLEATMVTKETEQPKPDYTEFLKGIDSVISKYNK